MRDPYELRTQESHVPAKKLVSFNSIQNECVNILTKCMFRMEGKTQVFERTFKRVQYKERFTQII